jgi:hypothetical protein
MPRLLRIYLFGCIAIASAYLLLHTREPLRLNVGDPWSDAATVASVEYTQQHGFTTPVFSDAYRPTHDLLTGVVYAATAKLGISDLGTLRLIALAFSMLWAWLVFVYVRRVWGDTIALLATALLATSMLWLTYADSIARPPIVHASCFLALWGLACAFETKQRRHFAAAIVGSFGCWFGGFDAWGFLLAGVLFTSYIKRADPFTRGHRGVLMLCAAGALAAIFIKSRFVIGPVDWRAGSVEWQAAIDRSLVTQLPTLLRRYALVFTPMFWITLVYTTWRALRAPSLRSVIEEGAIWLLAAAVLVLYVSTRSMASPMLRALPVLPFYAVGTSILVARLLEGRRISRGLGIAWAAVAPAWGVYLVLSHPRSVLDGDDVARTRSYFAATDRNDFVMSNLLSDGPIQAAFGRHNWPAPAPDLERDREANTHLARLQMLYALDVTGTDYIHAVIFTTPESRFVDRSLGQLVARGKLASVIGWPDLVRSKANDVIGDYDKKVLTNLTAVGATQVLRLSNFDVYRIDRTTLLELAGRSVPVVREIDFSSPGSNKHKLLGWDAPRLTAEDQRGATRIAGRFACWDPVLHRTGELAGNACETAPTSYGLDVLQAPQLARAQLMIRVERVCDLRLTLELTPSKQLAQLELELASSTLEPSPSTMAFASSMRLDLSVNDFTTSQCFPASRVSVLVPQRAVRAGVNIVTLNKQRFGWHDPWADIVSLTIEPRCESGR